MKYVKGIDRRETLGLLRSFQQGDVAQLVRACGSYPQCPGFKSLHRHHLENNKASLFFHNRGAYLFIEAMRIFDNFLKHGDNHL